MITNSGKTVIKNFFGQQTAQIGGCIAVGTGATASSLTDTKLYYETARIDVTSVTADLPGNRIIFKGVLSPGLTGKVYEIGLYHTNVRGQTVDMGIFDASTDPWINGTLVATNARRGINDLKVDATVNATTVASLSNVSVNLSSFLSTDSVAIAFTADVNLAVVKLRLGTDASNYREFTFSSPAVGYNTRRVNMSAGVDVGVVNMASITYVAIVPTATAGGTTSLYLDGIRVEDNATVNELVAVQVLSSPQAINANIPTEIEYSLGITV